MKALIFLTTRRIKNSILRSFRTPVRGIMTVLIIAYFLIAFAAFILADKKPDKLISGIPEIDLQIATAILLFAQALLFSILIPSPRYTFTILNEADVANIYPTPQNIWNVIRFFLFSRTFPLLFSFYLLISIYIFKFARMLIIIPESTSNALFVAFQLFIYVALVISSLSALAFWRFVIDIREEFGLIPKKFFLWSILFIASVIVLSALFYIQEAISAGKHALIGFTKSIESFPSLFLLYPFKAHALLLVGKFDAVVIIFSLAFWILFSVSGYSALKSELPRLYEYAARLASFRADLKNRLRNPSELIKEEKIKKNIIIELPLLFRRFKPKRAFSILWKDGVIAWRSYGSSFKLMTSIFIPAIIGIWFLLHANIIQVNSKAFRIASILGIIFTIAPYCFASIMIFAETMKKSELQKPLPISSLQAVTMHILQWTITICLNAVLPIATAIIFFPAFVEYFIFAFIVGCFFAYNINSAYFLVVLFNPDMLDPIQRMYASIFGIGLSVLVCIPGIAILIIGSIFQIPKMIIIFSVVIVNLICVSILHFISAKKYENFLFTE